MCRTVSCLSGSANLLLAIKRRSSSGINKSPIAFTGLLLVFTLSILFQPCQADLINNPLVKAVSQSLNVNDKQAAGGIGSLLQMAGSSVTSREFNKLKQAIPDASDLIAKAPPVATKNSTSGYSDFSEEGLMGSLAPLTSQFSALGMDSHMIMPMINKVLDYLKGNNSTAAFNILQSALPSDLMGGATKSLLNAW
ncbi:DUF2780 domain-containing protein [Endozoicomonas montiporae]|uniref:DUF2780 domain-containing protein n=1 Tax=Endozoicomonas montiporae CL-33 TaxID=570277 RepID=A0A142BE90_9GAMM|nr:DUF2780 domain-containing protein [Endozoicomonas montiporae]AMO57066.1 hypothetical protein EZMO1_3031 [Endozoicomonas montiporae CL-33]